MSSFKILLLSLILLPSLANATDCFEPLVGMQVIRADDNDGDFIINEKDNCPNMANADQQDYNRDLVGDACDLDGDGIGDQCDNCLNIFNPTQGDENANGIGDACDADVKSPEAKKQVKATRKAHESKIKEASDSDNDESEGFSVDKEESDTLPFDEKIDTLSPFESKPPL